VWQVPGKDEPGSDTKNDGNVPGKARMDEEHKFEHKDSSRLKRTWKLTLGTSNAFK